MQAQTQRKFEASEETVLAFKRHILNASKNYASDPMVDLFRVNLLGQMLDRYDALREKQMGDISAQSRVMYEFNDISSRMRAEGFTEQEEKWTGAFQNRPTVDDVDVETFIHESDDYLHKQSLGVAMITACLIPLMISMALTEIAYSDVLPLMGIVGMFAMIAMGVYALVTAVKPKLYKTIKKGKFTLSTRVRRRIEQMKGEVEKRARRRLGKGIVMLVTCIVPVVIGAGIARGPLSHSDFWPSLGVAGMFAMISKGVFEIIMSDGEKKTIRRLLKDQDN